MNAGLEQPFKDAQCELRRADAKSIHLPDPIFKSRSQIPDL
jgi:hypothetical protein